MNNINESAFHLLADKWLSQASDALEAADAAGTLEIECQHGALEIKLQGGKTLLISKHTPMRQLWLSSPISGGLHFNHRDGEWLLADGRNLNAIVSQELAVLAQLKVQW